MTAMPFTIGTNGGNVQSMSIYVATPLGTSPNNQYSMAIYANSSGAPGALIASTANGTLNGNAWNTLPITATFAPNTTYWLVYNSNGAAAQNNFTVSTSATSQEHWIAHTFGTWPASFGTVTGSAAVTGSIYATYAISVPDTTAPSTPTNLTATAISSSQINLTWTASTDNVGVMGYQVFRNGTQVGTPSGTSYNDTGLTAGTSYSYTVKAVDAANNVSAISNTASATTQSAVVIAPAFVQGGSKDAGIVTSGTLSFNSVNGRQSPSSRSSCWCGGKDRDRK